MPTAMHQRRPGSIGAAIADLRKTITDMGQVAIAIATKAGEIL